MPIFFRKTPVKEPLIFDSIGNHWNQDYVLRPKGFPLYHFLQTEKGLGKIDILGHSYLLHEGEGILIAPYVKHSYHKEGEQWQTLFITFTGTIEGSFSKILGNRQVVLTGKSQGIKFASMITNIIHKYNDTPNNTKSLSIDCYCLLMNLVDDTHNNNLMKDPLYSRYITPVIKEIETNYKLEITVQELSKLVFVTPQYLSRLFRRFLGYSVYEYLTIYRLNKAKEFLISNQRMEIQQIAQQVGFHDTSHFISIFKKVVGITPLKFRKLH